MLGSFPPLRGISSYCYELSKSIAGKNCRVEFISFKSMYPAFLYPGKDLKDDNTFPSADNPYLHVKRKIAWYNPLGWISGALESNGMLLHAQWWSPPLAPIYFCICLLFRIKRKPVVFTVHNVFPHERSLFFSQVSRFLFLLGNHFIVHSAINRKQLMDYYEIPSAKISLIPHGPLDLQVNAYADRDKIRSELGFNKDHKVVLLFGAIRPYKGIDTAITAFARVKKQIPAARLLIVGKLWQDWTPYDAMIRKCGIEKQVVTRLDYIPSADVHRYFCAADLVVLPYRHFDSQSGVGGTAVSFRKPLIVTQVGGLPELLIDTGAVVPPGDPNALAQAIYGCLNDPERLLKLSKDAEIVAQRLSWDSIAEKTVSIYEKLLRRKMAGAGKSALA